MKRKRNKFEWHLISIATFALAVTIFILTFYKGFEMAAAFAILSVLVQPIYSSDSWKLLSSQTHKRLTIFFLITLFGWIMRLLFINKILPKYRSVEINN